MGLLLAGAILLSWVITRAAIRPTNAVSDQPTLSDD